MAAAIAEKRSLYDVVIVEPLDLVKAQPHQILLSTGSVALMGQYAGSSGIVHPLVGYCIAVGVEWAYLRGLADDSKNQTAWGATLNWSAFVIVVLWGILWVAKVTGVVPEHPEGWLGWFLAASHIVPIAWLSLCSAMCHRAAMTAKAKADADVAAEQLRIQREANEARRLFELEQAAEDAKLQRWQQAQRFKLELKQADAQMQGASPRNAVSPLSSEENAPSYFCPKCSTALNMKQYAAAKRWGHCPSCKGQ